MPTGRVATKEELKELIDLAREHQFLIVNDNPYSLILNDQPLSMLGLEGAGEVALELNSLSKSHNMAGWRLGWVTGRREYIEAVLRVKSNMDSGMFLGLQHAAAEALNSGTAWFSQVNDLYARRKTVAVKILDALDCTYSGRQAGLFVWAKAGDRIADIEKWIDEILYETKVFITPGFIFGDAGRRYIRISLCSTEEALTEALRRIESFLEKRGQSTIKSAIR
jgi:aspartate/methionine/tyrosine aminotransferase